MKKWILPACLIVVGLVVAAFGYFHVRSAISRSTAEQIATDYIINSSSYYEKDNFKIEIANLDLDIISMVIGNQKWKVFAIFPQCWLSINAYTAEIEEVHDGFYEWVTQSENTLPLGSCIIITLYLLIVIFSFFYWKGIAIRIIFWVFVVILCVILFFNILINILPSMID